MKVGEELYNTLALFVVARRLHNLHISPLLLGECGIGKTSLVVHSLPVFIQSNHKKLKITSPKFNSVNLIDESNNSNFSILMLNWSLANIPPESVLGFPVARNSHYVSLLPPYSIYLLKHAEFSILLFDEIQDAETKVIRQIRELIRSGKIADFEIPTYKFLPILIANPPEEDPDADLSFPPAVFDRLCILYVTHPSVNDYINMCLRQYRPPQIYLPLNFTPTAYPYHPNYTKPNQHLVNPIVISFLQQYHAQYYIIPASDKQRRIENLENFPTPRSWTEVQKILNALSLNPSLPSFSLVMMKFNSFEELLREILVGILGIDVGNVFLEFLKNQKAMFNLTDFISKGDVKILEKLTDAQLVSFVNAFAISICHDYPENAHEIFLLLCEYLAQRNADLIPVLVSIVRTYMPKIYQRLFTDIFNAMKQSKQYKERVKRLNRFFKAMQEQIKEELQKIAKEYGFEDLVNQIFQ